MNGFYSVASGRHLESSCRAYQYRMDEQLVTVACGTCGGPIQVKGRESVRVCYCSPGCQQAGRDEREHNQGAGE